MIPLDVSDLAGILLENTPRDAAKETLWRLGTRFRARSIALWQQTPNNELALEMGVGVDGEALAKAGSLFAGRPADSPAPVQAEGAILAEIPHPVGWWVYADGINLASLDMRILVDFASVAATALHRSYSADGDETSSYRTLKSMKRDELVASLHLNEWNIARTARARGVTRKTIYDWLERYKIARERVPK